MDVSKVGSGKMKKFFCHVVNLSGNTEYIKFMHTYVHRKTSRRTPTKFLSYYLWVVGLWVILILFSMYFFFAMMHMYYWHIKEAQEMIFRHPCVAHGTYTKLLAFTYFSLCRLFIQDLSGFWPQDFLSSQTRLQAQSPLPCHLFLTCSTIWALPLAIVLLPL